MKNIYTAIGLMSGTSLDGVDVAMVKTDGEDILEFIASSFLAYLPEFSKKMQNVAKNDVPLSDVLRLEREITDYHVTAVNNLLNKTNAKADIIGFHGQTIRHLPDEGLTWQIGDSNYLAAKLNIPVVGDFRRRDMANGGQGAPLVPLFHKALFYKQNKPCAIVNIGGVANMTYLSENGDIKAGDCGTGMGLVDILIQKNTNQQYDNNGEIGLSGNIDNSVLKKALSLPFFKKTFPKSADRYDFDAIDTSNLAFKDGVATLVAVTAQGILQCLPTSTAHKNITLWLTGGGAKNQLLVDLLQKSGAKVRNIEEINLRPDTMEAECFAWLAVRRLKNLPLCTTKTTGCVKSSCGGVLTV